MPASTPAPRPAIELAGVTKRYPLFSRRRDRVLGLLGWRTGLAYKTALADVDVTVGMSEAVGIIGENGSGKSTMLRIIAGVTDPDLGTVETTPPVAAILELGLGFHPQFTGRENAMLYGALVGVREEVMRERLDEVLAFAELGEVVDQPLRTYSSGMAARLAFAVATNVEPQVLVVDEALAVGDGAFQKKCVNRMMSFRESGRTVLFCSHSMYWVTSFCQRAIWLRGGRVEADGEADKVVTEYQRYLLQRETAQGQQLSPGSTAGRLARFRRVAMRRADGRESGELHPRDPVTFLFDVEATGLPTPCHLGLALFSLDGRCVLATSTQNDGLPPFELAGRQTAELRVPSLPLAGGEYTVKVFLLDESGLLAHDQTTLEGGVTVLAPSWVLSVLVVDHEWVVRT